MKTFTEYLTEITTEREIEAKKLAADLESVAKKYFPNGFAATSFSTSFNIPAITFQFGMISDKADVSNGIRLNDPADHMFMISLANDGFEAKMLRGSISTNPEKGSHMAMGRIKSPFRKTKGDSKKMLKTFDTFFQRLKKLIADNKDNIYRSDKIKDKYFK
jgi:hypothetical protein